MLGNVSPRALRITSHPVVYSGRNNVTRLTLEALSGRRYVPLNANAVTRWVLVFPQLTPQVLIDSAVNPVFTASVGALEVDLSGFALDASIQPCWLIAYDAEHPDGQVLVDNADCVVAFTFRQVSGAGLVPLPAAEYLTDAPADGKVYARKNQVWVEASALVSGVASVNGQSGTVVLTAADVGADTNGAGTAAVAGHVALPDPHSQYVLDSEKGAANGVATLDGTGKVPTAQLPVVGAPLGSSTPQPLGTATAGVATSSSREDHVHALPSAAQVGAIPATEKGAANGVATLDAGSKVPLAQLPPVGAQLGSATPQALGVAAAGTSSNASREDHVHAMPTAASVGAVPASEKGVVGGVATLDTNGLVPLAQLPSVAITDTFVVNSQAAMLALTAQRGDVAIRTDISSSFILQADPASTLANWQSILTPATGGGAAVGSAVPQPLGSATPGVSSNASREDHVHAMPTKADLSLGNVDNTSDANKPVSTAQQTALNAKVNTSAVGAANGVASLGADAKVPTAQLPALGAPVGSATPQALGTAAAGTSSNASREDHVHAMPSAANVGAVATSAVGAANGVASLDSGGKVPTAQLPALGAAVGSATPQNLGTATAGVSANASREDHVHAMPTAADVGAAPSSHVGATGTAHGVATTSVAGFMAAADKTKLDGIATGATANQTDAYLLNRANHTGSQAISTVTGLQAALDKATFAPVITDATAARTFALTDAAGYIRFTSASPVTATVPAQASVAWAADTEINLEQNGTGSVTVVAAAGVTINGIVAGSFTLAGRYAAATLKRLAADTWTLIYGSAAFSGGTLTSALNEAPIVTLASAATVAIGAAAANTINVSGTATITAFDTIAAGAVRRLVFQDAATLTHNATSLILPTGANIVAAAGDVGEFLSLGGGNWRCISWQRAASAGMRQDSGLGTAATFDVGTAGAVVPRLDTTNYWSSSQRFRDLRFIGSGAGATNIAFMGFYESDGVTRTAWIGDGSSGSTSFCIGADAADGTIDFYPQGSTLSYRASTASFSPVGDNVRSAGAAATRWSTIYAGTGTINTSDAREKTAVRALTASELAAAKQLASEIGVYQFLSSVAEKGAAARQHIGMTVQRAIEIMQANGLDPFAYGFICYDQWGEQAVDHPAEYEQVLQEDGSYADGALVREAWTEVVREAGDRYSFRMDELLAFVARGQAERLGDLERRLAAIGG